MLPEWMNERACQGLDPRKFDATPGEKPVTKRVLEAKAICAGCPVLLQCREFGMEEEHSVYGGLAPCERKDLRHERANAARRSAG